MFEDLQEPDLADRVRAAAAWPLGAYLLVQIYFTLYPLLAEVPRWLFEAVRADLGIGMAVGVAAGLRALPLLRQPGGRPGLRAAGWMAAFAGALCACGWTLAGMSWPWMV